jgi:hypothetical protein
MSESRTGEHPDDTESGDALRQHAQEPAEGPDEDAENTADVPRVHTEDPAEG